MSIVYEIMKDWIGDDVRIVTSRNGDGFTGKLSEICDTGIFLMVEGDEYFLPWNSTHFVKHIKEINDGV